MKDFDIIKNWSRIKTHFSQSFSTNLHVSIASVDAQNQPTITPIGSFFLTKNQKGFYFEIFASKLPQNQKQNKNVCVLAVNSGKWFWIKSIFTGRFGKFPAVKLYGELGERREATPIEQSRLQRRLKRFRNTKGYEMLWGSTPFVRDIYFTKAEMANLGKMTKNL